MTSLLSRFARQLFFQPRSHAFGPKFTMTLESLGVEVHSASLGMAKFRAEFIRVWTLKGNAICRERPLRGAQLRRAGIVWRVVTRLRDKPRRAPSSSNTGRVDQALQVTTVIRRWPSAIAEGNNQRAFGVLSALTVIRRVGLPGRNEEFTGGDLLDILLAGSSLLSG